MIEGAPILPPIALSVRQPWAWAIVAGIKDIENRSSVALNKGDMAPKRICIHAAKGMTIAEYERASWHMLDLGYVCPNPDRLVRGAIIGACTVIDVVSDHDSPWFFGPRGLVLTGQIQIPPIACLGKLGYFKWSVGGRIDEPKPWMKTWPENPRSDRRPSTRQMDFQLPNWEG